MALSWLLHSAYSIVLGHPKTQDQNILGYPNKQVGEVAKSIKMMKPSEGFQVPLHYPRYTKAEYEKMEEWRVDLLLQQYGLKFEGVVEEKRAYAMGAFLWPQQL